MELILWAIVLLVSLFALTKGADYFIKGAEEIGLSYGLSPFVIGVLLVGMGTSLPEFASAIAAIFAQTTEIITANAIGSNIANILLVIGMLTVVVGKLKIDKDLIDIEIPLFVISTLLFFAVASDGIVTAIESVFLASGFLIYFIYSIYGHGELPATVEEGIKELIETKPSLIGSYIYTIVGLIALVAGAKFLIQAIIEIALVIDVSPGVISLTAVAIGTSLPEFFVSLNAARSGKIDLAIGNIFGSNAFNILFIVGIPGLFGALAIDPKTFAIGLPVLAAASIIFLTSNLSRRLYKWEGMMFLVFYLFFLMKLFGVV